MEKSHRKNPKLLEDVQELCKKHNVELIQYSICERKDTKGCILKLKIKADELEIV